MGTRNWLRRLDRLERQRRTQGGVGSIRPLTDMKWADAFDRYQRELAPRDAEFAAAAEAYRRAVAEAQGQCGPDEVRQRELWPHFPAVARTWDRCAELAERLLQATCRRDER